jgi:flagellar biosynthetic protein FliR
MTVDVATPLLVGFLLATVRGAAWLVVSPPFNSRVIPGPVKAALAVALAVPVAPKLAASAPEPTLTTLLGGVVVQVLAGVALGFVTYLLFAAVQAAGDLMDLFGGFSLAYGFDPLSMQQNSVFGRLHSLLALMLLFALDGHLLVIHGFLTSYDALPLDATMSLGDLARLVTTGIGQFFVAALQIAAPLIGVLFLVDVALGLLTRVSPALNAFALGFPAKIFATLLLVAAALPVLPQAVEWVVSLALRAGRAALGG